MNKVFMNYALEEAKKAKSINEVPVGAIIVRNNTIIGRGHNNVEISLDATAHAEIIAIKDASSYLGNWRLKDCEMYVTLEPCPMCAGAIIQSRLKKVYIGTYEPNLGACGSVIDILQNRYLNSNIEVQWMYIDECSSIIEDFFKERRK